MTKTAESNLPDIEFHEDHSRVDWQELEALFALTNLGGRKGDKLRRAFLNSQVVCYAFDGNRLVGVGRAITDGEYHAFVYDVAVHPGYQGRGLGTKVVRMSESGLALSAQERSLTPTLARGYGCIWWAGLRNRFVTLRPDTVALCRD